MLKKISQFIRFCFICALWSLVFLSVTAYFFKTVYNFNLFKKQHWQIISRFWEEGGVINTTQEVLFILCLLAIIPLWFYGLHKSLKISLVKILFFPIFIYNAYQEKKYSKTPKSIVLKNMGLSFGKKSPRQEMEDMIASRMPKETDKKDLNSNKIRSSLEEKSTDFHKKTAE